MLWTTSRSLLMAALFPGRLVPSAFPQDSFYKGKTVRFIVGAPPGGGFDTYSRAITRHIEKHIPGNPTMLVDNMPAAAGLVAANYVYKASRPDGLSVGTFVGGLFLQQMLGRNELVDACPVEKEANWITEIDQPLSTHFNS